MWSWLVLHASCDMHKYSVLLGAATSRGTRFMLPGNMMRRMALALAQHYTTLGHNFSVLTSARVSICIMLFDHVIFGLSLFPKVSWITSEEELQTFMQTVWFIHPPCMCAAFWRCSRWLITGSKATVRASVIAAVSQSSHTTESPAVTVAGVKSWSVIIHALYNDILYTSL